MSTLLRTGALRAGSTAFFVGGGYLVGGGTGVAIAIAVAMILFFIVNPQHGARLARLFATHPAIEERVRRLKAMAARRGPARDGPSGARRAA